MSQPHTNAGTKPILAAWRALVHHIVHPVSGAIVLVAAGVEVFEWLLVACEHLAHVAETMLGQAGG